MPLEPNIYALWAGKQSAKTTEQTTPAKRFIQVGGDINFARDDGTEQYSDLSKYGGRTRWINGFSGSGNPLLEATPGELGWLLWALHGAETFVAGTDNIQTLAGNPTSGTFNLVFWDGFQSIVVGTALANTTTAAALDTAIEAALITAGYPAGGQVTCAGGPLNTTPITITFNGAAVAKRPFITLTKASDTTSPAVTITNTTPGVRAKHTFNPQSTIGFYTTWQRRLGTSTIQRHSFIDTLVTGVTLDGSTGTKPLHMAPVLNSLDPLKTLTADPTVALPTGIDARPFLYNESSGAFVLNGNVVNAQTDFTFTIDENRTLVYADDVVPYDLAVGQPTATIAVTLIMDATVYLRWNEQVYGTASPAPGTKPNKFLPPFGSYTADWKQKDGQGNLTGNEFKLTLPAVMWSLPDSGSPNPAGGTTTVSFSGTIEPPFTGQTYTLDVFNADGAAYT